MTEPVDNKNDETSHSLTSILSGGSCGRGFLYDIEYIHYIVFRAEGQVSMSSARDVTVFLLPAIIVSASGCQSSDS